MDYLFICQLDIKADFVEKEVLSGHSYLVLAPESIYLRHLKELKDNMVEITTSTCNLLPTIAWGVGMANIMPVFKETPCDDLRTCSL